MKMMFGFRAFCSAAMSDWCSAIVIASAPAHLMNSRRLCRGAVLEADRVAIMAVPFPLLRLAELMVRSIRIVSHPIAPARADNLVEFSFATFSA